MFCTSPGWRMVTSSFISALFFDVSQCVVCVVPLTPGSFLYHAIIDYTGALHIAATSLSASSSEGDCTGGYRTLGSMLGTNSGTSSLSVLLLVGKINTEEHGVPSSKAGHWH